jgi:dolichyl-phosphate-mannose-protein mannosyltransferase
VLGIGIASKWIVLAAWASIIFFIVLRLLARSLNFDWGPRGWPFLFRRRDEGQRIPRVQWPVYMTLALIALVLIPAVVYLLSWYPFFARGQFHTFADLVRYQLDSFNYHKNLTATHPYGSPAWSWPFLARPVLYYAQYEGLGKDVFTGQVLWARMSNLGNPWIWWTSLPCVASLPYFIVRHRSFPAAVILLGFISQYAPWFPIMRVLFMYHMFGGLIFMVLALAFVLAYVAQKLRPPNRQALVAVHLATTVLFFGYFYPVWTAVPISSSAWFEGPGTPPWGPKIWLVNCRTLPPSQPQIFCWN